MSRKIKFHSLHFLFRVFAYLADKSGGWYVFVKPKLIIGSMILGISLTACDTKKDRYSTEHTNKKFAKKAFSTDLPTDSKTEKVAKPTKLPIHFQQPLVSCYDTEVTEIDSIKTKTTKKADSTLVTAILCYSPINLENDKKDIDTTGIYDIVEQMPIFPGGKKELISFIGSNYRIPPTLAEDCYQGSIICRFIVNTDGTLSNFEIIRSLHPLLDKEAIRVLKLLPKFIPGKQNGKPVRVYYTLPVKYN